jgi:CRISPR-associated protein Cas1
MEVKINNQRIILKRQSEYKQIDVVPQLDQLNVIKHKIWKSESLDQVLGYEGSAARIYFSGLNNLITSEFKFNGRSKRPPKDPFNALLSFGYTILFNEILGKIDAKGLNSYFGFIHQDKENHPTLASDLMEEWRPLIIDSVVMNIINNGDITRRNFTEPNENEGVYVNREGLNMFISSVEDKLHSENKYLDYILEPVSNRHAMELQVNSFVKAIELEDASVYHPIRIR